MSLIECYDVGGTNLRGAVFNSETDKIVTESTVKTNKNKSDFLKQLASLSNFLRKGVNKISLVSLGVPGPVEDNVLLESPPMHLKEKIDFSKEAGFSEKVNVLNDMDAAVLAEKNFGWGANLDSICLVTLSTGIGAGTIINGNLIPGGEYGHIVLEKNGPVCSCGNRGCWASFSSGYAIEKSTGMKSEDFFEVSTTESKKSIERIRDFNARGFANIINAVKVDKIVVMGSLGLRQFDQIVPNKEEIKRYTINNIPDIVPTKLGKGIGLLGAYVSGRNEVIN